MSAGYYYVLFFIFSLHFIITFIVIFVLRIVFIAFYFSGSSGRGIST